LGSNILRANTRSPHDLGSKEATSASTYAPWASSPATRIVMQGNRKRDTRPELAVRRATHALGLRYRVAYRPLRGRRWTADLVFPRLRVAVFVDGCYWHGCPEHFHLPRTNTGYWGPKVERNRVRDLRVDGDLQEAGWTVLRLWEHVPITEAAQRIAAVVAEAREGQVVSDAHR
jgi:DNA mismatch endonuclease (patch repair protein)